MSTISHKEIERQYRVLRQTLGMHSILRDEYALKANISQSIIILCSVIFCATTFAYDQLFEEFNLTPSSSRIILGIASVLAFGFSLILMFGDWRGKSAQHKEAASRWTSALEKFRKYRLDTGSWPETAFDELCASYWEADRNSVAIPNNRFNGLKSRYLRKMAISEAKSAYPACPRFVLYTILLFKDSFRAIRNNMNSRDA